MRWRTAILVAKKKQKHDNSVDDADAWLALRPQHKLVKKINAWRRSLASSVLAKGIALNRGIQDVVDRCWQELKLIRISEASKAE